MMQVLEVFAIKSAWGASNTQSSRFESQQRDTAAATIIQLKLQ